MSSSQDASQMEKQTRPYPTLPGPFSNTSVGLNAPPQEVVAAKNGVKYSILGLQRANHRLSTWQPSVARILSGKQNPASCCLPCITSIHNCILMDAEDTTLYDCHGLSDLSDP